MTDPRDEFYQPWLREPPKGDAAPVKRRFEAADAPGGLARDEALPLGVDLSGYVLDETPPPPPLPARARPAARAAGTAITKGWTGLRSRSAHGARRFADWTIALGAAADIPAHVAALGIPRRTGVATRKAGLMLAAAGRAIAAATGRGGKASWRAAQQLGGQARRGLTKAVASTTAAGERQLGKLRPAPATAPTETPPASGLDQLLAAQAPAPAAESDGLPLFSAPPRAMEPATPPPPATAPTASTPTPSAPAASGDAQPARSSAPAAPPPAGQGGGLSFAGDGVGGLPRWLPWAAAALLLLALSFWLGSRWGGGGLSRAEVETIVRDTIAANPEIVPQALEAHQANQMAAAIDDIRPVLEKPFAGAWVGNAKGDVTLTVFTDYGCVFCRASVADVDRLVREDARVKVVFRELPIIAPQSKDAAIAALAAARQGKYDAFHHAMFAAPSLDKAAIDAASTRAGVILDGRSDASVDTRLFEREIDNNLALAQQLGVNATPTWIIGSRMLQGAVGYDMLKKAVADARAAN